MSPHSEVLLSMFHELRPQLEQLSDYIYAMISGTLKEQGIELNAIEHRVKSEESLAGKLTKKGDKYQSGGHSHRHLLHR